MKTFIIVAGTVAAFSAFPAQRAQALPLVPPVSVEVGVGTLASSAAGDKTTSTGLHAGASVGFAGSDVLFAFPSTNSIDADYNYNSGRGGHIEVEGLTLTKRVYLVPQALQTLTLGTSPYVGLGVGAFRTDGSVDQNGNTNHYNTTQVGGKALVGVRFPGGTFVEASYIVAGATKKNETLEKKQEESGIHFERQGCPFEKSLRNYT